LKPLGRVARIPSIFGLAVIGLLLLASTASARDYESAVAEAQSRVATASVEVGELKSAVAPLRTRLTTAEKHAAPTRHAAHAASARLAATKRRLQGSQAYAVKGIADIKAEQKGASEKHDHDVAFDIGLGLAALVVAVIALAWGWFRASAIVAALTRIPLAKAAGATVGTGFVTLIIGSALAQPGGVVGVIGGCIFGLSLALPVCLLLARHSAEVQRGRSKPLLRRERLSPTVTRTIGGAFALLFLIALIAAATKNEKYSRSVPEQLRSQAVLVSSSAPKVQVDQKRAAALRKQLMPMQTMVAEQRSDLLGAQRKLRHAEARLVDARSDERQWSHALEAAETKERRELEKEELLAQRRQEKEEREYARAVEREEQEAEKLAHEQEESEGCDPNYVGACLHEGIGDYDCAGGSGDGPNYVSGPIEVVGADEFGLDSDGDGIACEDG
jgi:hypothetical protein